MSNLPSSPDLSGGSSREAESKKEIKALIVEDDDGLRMLAGINARFGNFSVQDASNVPDALKLLEKAQREGQPIGLVLTDLKLMDREEGGFEIAKAVRERGLAKCVILSTANDTAQRLTPEQLKEKNVDILLKKPASAGDFGRAFSKARQVMQNPTSANQR